MLAFGEKNLGPPPTWQEQNVLETNSSNNTMNLLDQSSNGITRRNFMKKTALTVGAVTILGQGIGLAVTTSTRVCSQGGTCTPGEEYQASTSSRIENGKTLTYTLYAKDCTKCGQVVSSRGVNS